MNLTKLDKIVKWVAYGIEAAMVITIVALSIAVGAKNRTIKAYRQQLKAQTEEYAGIQAYADSLAKLECVSVANTIVVNQKGLVNTTAANQISRTVATYTREEIISALDSLRRVNNDR